MTVSSGWTIRASSFASKAVGASSIPRSAVHSRFWVSSCLFQGADRYRQEDIPESDLLIITHDHCDHLDAGTVEVLRTKVAKAGCPLGFGAHLAYWA